MSNPEQSVIDCIDALVDEQIDNYDNRSGYDHNVNQAVCALCGGEWHGTRAVVNSLDPWAHTGRTLGCPGAYATGPQRIRFRHRRAIDPRQALRRRWGQARIEIVPVVGNGSCTWLEQFIETTYAYAAAVASESVSPQIGIDPCAPFLLPGDFDLTGYQPVGYSQEMPVYARECPPANPVHEPTEAI